MLNEFKEEKLKILFSFRSDRWKKSNMTIYFMSKFTKMEKNKKWDIYFREEKINCGQK